MSNKIAPVERGKQSTVWAEERILQYFVKILAFRPGIHITGSEFRHLIEYGGCSLQITGSGDVETALRTEIEKVLRPGWNGAYFQN